MWLKRFVVRVSFILPLALTTVPLGCATGGRLPPGFHCDGDAFSIAPLVGSLDSPRYKIQAPSAPRSYTALKMFLPATEGFAPNVIVLVQPFRGTRKDWEEETKRGIEGTRYTQLRQALADKRFVWEGFVILQRHMAQRMRTSY